MNIFSRYFIAVVTKKYKDFSGRASRSEFWFFLLFYIIFTSVTLAIDTALYAYELIPHFLSDFLGPQADFGMVTALFMLLLMIPSIALIVRRIHDTGKSTVWILLIFIPLLGFFAYFYFGLKSGEDGENKYGLDPEIEIDRESTSSRNDAFDSKEDVQSKSKSGKWIKIIGGTILVIVLLIGASFIFIGNSIVSIGKTMGINLDQVNQFIVANTTNSIETISIKVPLSKQYVLKYPNLSLCTPEKEKKNAAFSQIIADGYNPNYICVNEKCEISIDIEDPKIYPKSIEIYQTNSKGLCKKTSLRMNKPIIKGYEAVMPITPQLLAQLKITDNAYKFIPTGTSNYTKIKEAGIEKLKLNYSEMKDKDTLLIDNKPRVILIFEKQKKKKDDPYRELQMIEDEIVQLKAKRSNLLERLD